MTPTNSRETDSSLIPNSQTSVIISECNIVTGKRPRKKKILMNRKYIIIVLGNYYAQAFDSQAVGIQVNIIR